MVTVAQNRSSYLFRFGLISSSAEKKTFRISVHGLSRFGFDHKKNAIFFYFVLILRYQKSSLVPERVTLQKRSTGTPFRSLPARQHQWMIDPGYQLIICETLIINLLNFVIYLFIYDTYVTMWIIEKKNSICLNLL